ncbi:transporter substrate-binding domain-containing protein [Citricoccus alkalitolerans]|uniref:Transporter substrate-binding domain-containing protein n=1 Tax=Citricoccus alkalitolerans TaxID=246603 RepID=A0ABV8XZG9_9MICC
MSISRKTAMTSGFLVAAVALTATGCTSSAYPADPNGTFDDVSGGTLSVGVVHHPPYVDATGAEPSGSEVELIRTFAEEIDAEIEWTASGEEALITALETGDVDLMAGGLTDQSPWSSQAGLTRSYAEDTGPDGKTVKLVLAVPLGENQMLGELERFLDERHAEVAP